KLARRNLVERAEKHEHCGMSKTGVGDRKALIRERILDVAPQHRLELRSRVEGGWRHASTLPGFCVDDEVGDALRHALRPRPRLVLAALHAAHPLGFLSTQLREHRDDGGLLEVADAASDKGARVI